VVVAVDTTTIAAAAAAATGRHNNRPTMDIIREAAAIEVVAITTMLRRFVPVVVVVDTMMVVVADEVVVVVADTTMVVVAVADTTTEVEAVVVVDTVAVRGTVAAAEMVDEVAVIIVVDHPDHHLHLEEDRRPIDDARSHPMSWCSTRSTKNGNGWPNDVANVKRANRDLMSLPKTWVCRLRLSHHRRRWIPMRHRCPCTVPLDKRHHHRRRHCIPIRPMAMELDQQHRTWDCRCKRVTLDACTWAICHCKLPKNKFSRPFGKPFT
jgi:hypothetical protein